MNRLSLIGAVSCFTLCLWSCDINTGDQLTIAVATNFLTTAEALVEQYEEQSDVAITLVSGSSGQLFAQAKSGAPYDVFFSADQEKIKAIIDEKLGLEDSRVTYALGRLCLMLNPSKQYEHSARALFENLEFNRIAYANPKLAPYGTAAEEVFTALGIDLSKGLKKVILADNVGRAYAITLSGNVDVGMVALSSVLDDKLNSEYFYIIPEKYYSPLRQDAIILSRTKNEAIAREFMNFIQTSDAQAIIRNNGYELD